MSTKPRWLYIPVGDGLQASVPLGIREEDYELLQKALELWKPKLVPKLPEPEYHI